MTTTIVTILVALITAVCGPMTVEWAKVKLNKKKQIDVVAEAIQSNELVDHQLDLILEEIGCDRLWVAQFHNGGHFYPTGKSIKKFSIFYEKLIPGLNSIKETFQNIPVSLFSKVLFILYRDGEIVINNYNHKDESYGLFPFINENKTKSFFMIAIDDLEGNLTGILTVEYSTKSHPLSQEEWIFLRQKVGVIGSLLDNYLHSKNK